jgi:hypothetical protein
MPAMLAFQFVGGPIVRYPVSDIFSPWPVFNYSIDGPHCDVNLPIIAYLQTFTGTPFVNGNEVKIVIAIEFSA